MLDPAFLLAGVLNGLLAGGIYVLVAVGLTLIYGVLHIINFAHGSLLMLAMYAVFWLWRLAGIDPYAALPLVIAGSFAFGFVLYRLLIGRYNHGRDENILLITLGLSIVFDNAALLFFGGNTQTIGVPYAGTFVELGAAFLPLPKVVSCAAALLICLALGLFMARTDTGKAIRVGITGSPGVGKRTVAEALHRLTGAVVLDNHRINLPIMSLFDWDGSEPIRVLG